MNEVFKVVPYRKVDNLEVDLRFYQEVLNYEIMSSLEDENGIYWADLRNGNDDIMLSSRKIYDRSQLTWLYVEDVEAAYQEVLRRGGEPLTEPLKNRALYR